MISVVVCRSKDSGARTKDWDTLLGSLWGGGGEKLENLCKKE